MNYNVLVVDDSSAVCRVIKRCLEILEFPLEDYFTANDGEKGLARLQKTPIHILFLDLHMPHMDGYEMIEKIEKLPSWSNLTVVIISSEPNKHRLRALMKPNVLFVPKPFTLEDIGDVVDKITKDMLA